MTWPSLRDGAAVVGAGGPAGGPAVCVVGPPGGAQLCVRCRGAGPGVGGADGPRADPPAGAGSADAESAAADSRTALRQTDPGRRPAADKTGVTPVLSTPWLDVYFI